MTVEASNNAGIAWDRGNPARRCVAKSRRTGERCRRWAIRGGTVCTTHGGSTRHIKRKAQERLDNAADRMARELLGIAVSADSEAVRLAAVRDALDRAGMNPKTAVEVSVGPYEQVLGGLAGVAHIAVQSREHGAVYPSQSRPNCRNQPLARRATRTPSWTRRL